MFQPESYSIALGLMIVSMLCWGSWANTLKLCPGYRFQLFYWDYVIGLVVGIGLWGLTLGSMGASGKPFLADIASAGMRSIIWSLIGGVIFNAANLLLVAAIEVAGLAVAFPVGIGLALIVGIVDGKFLSLCISRNERGRGTRTLCCLFVLYWGRGTLRDSHELRTDAKAARRTAPGNYAAVSGGSGMVAFLGSYWRRHLVIRGYR
jgi:hypothetical protein